MQALQVMSNCRADAADWADFLARAHIVNEESVLADNAWSGEGVFRSAPVGDLSEYHDSMGAISSSSARVLQVPITTGTMLWHLVSTAIAGLVKAPCDVFAVKRVGARDSTYGAGQLPLVVHPTVLVQIPDGLQDPAELGMQHVQAVLVPECNDAVEEIQSE